MAKRLKEDFYRRECLSVAQDLVGKILIHKTEQGVLHLRILETEAYCGESDTACHAHKGRTKRTEVMYGPAGTLYVYLCYGMHWMLNVVTGGVDDPQAVLIRACEDAYGPGKLTKTLSVTGTLNWENVLDSPEIWIEDDGFCCPIEPCKRIGIGYASQEDQDKLWRFKAVI